MHHLGHAIHHFALSLIGASDSDLVYDLHDSNEVKAYTVSGLMVDRRTVLWHGKIRPDDKAWVRLTALNQDIARVLTQFAATKPEIIKIDRHHWRLEQAALSTSEHPWAGRATFQSLWLQATQRPVETLHMEFATILKIQAGA